MDAIRLTESKAPLSERAGAAGESIDITRWDKAVATLAAFGTQRKRIEAASLQSLTATMPLQTQSAAELVRAMRDGDRY